MYFFHDLTIRHEMQIKVLAEDSHERVQYSWSVGHNSAGLSFA